MRYITRPKGARGTGARTWLGAGTVLVIVGSVAVAADHGRSRATITRSQFEAHALFVKIWEPKQAGIASGDGLGPLYNETSCVGCHHLGGTGGAGANDRNVVILTAIPSSGTVARGPALFMGELEDLHPGLRNHASVVVHGHTTAPGLEPRLFTMRSSNAVQTRDDVFLLRRSERNTPALFGTGIIDAIADSVLLEAEKRRFAGFPEIKGKVSRLVDGRLGRFGWKGQTARLNEFVLNACANELGLEVPGHHQGSLASAREFDPQKLNLDLDQAQCDLLLSFVASLPPPLFGGTNDLPLTSWGYAAFEKIGCAACHTPTLGQARGIYSDLLLHDLGNRMRDSGGYGMPSRIVDHGGNNHQSPSAGETNANDWRTPPLWGVADSAPYLHDGRAASLDEAIRLHGGEAALSTDRYTKLGSDDRQALLAFLQAQTVGQRPHAHAQRKAKRSNGRAPEGASRL
jgi:CxxC motif-containing protein (DUF1111 family)